MSLYICGRHDRDWILKDCELISFKDQWCRSSFMLSIVVVAYSFAHDIDCTHWFLDSGRTLLFNNRLPHFFGRVTNSFRPSFSWRDVSEWFLAHGWRSHAMGFWTHSFTHSILINLFIKVKLNTLLLPPLLSYTFVPSALFAHVSHIREGTSKVYIFSRHKRVVKRRWHSHEKANYFTT